MCSSNAYRRRCRWYGGLSATKAIDFRWVKCRAFTEWTFPYWMGDRDTLLAGWPWGNKTKIYTQPDPVSSRRPHHSLRHICLVLLVPAVRNRSYKLTEKKQLWAKLVLWLDKKGAFFARRDVHIFCWILFVSNADVLFGSSQCRQKVSLCAHNFVCCAF